MNIHLLRFWDRSSVLMMSSIRISICPPPKWQEQNKGEYMLLLHCEQIAAFCIFLSA